MLSEFSVNFIVIVLFYTNVSKIESIFGGIEFKIELAMNILLSKNHFSDTQILCTTYHKIYVLNINLKGDLASVQPEDWNGILKLELINISNIDCHSFIKFTQLLQPFNFLKWV